MTLIPPSLEPPQNQPQELTQENPLGVPGNIVESPKTDKEIVENLREKPHMTREWRRAKFLIPQQQGGGLNDLGYAFVESMAKCGCTRAEISASLGINRETLWSYEKQDPYITELIENGHEVGRQELRRLQRRAARKGSNAMLIWLGKQWLGQSEKAEIKSTEETSISSLDLSNLSDAEAAAFQSLLKKATGNEPGSSIAPLSTVPPDKRNKDPYHVLLRTKGKVSE